MSGSKTRYGFTGGDDTPDPEEARVARTVPGRDVHLQMPPDIEPPQFPVAHTPVPPEPAPAQAPTRHAIATPGRPTVRIEDLDESDPRREHQRPQPSRLARFLGRWTKSGRFLSHSRLAMNARNTIRISRDATSRNILLVLLVAFFTFIITLSAVKMRQNFMTPPAPPAAPASIATQPAQPPPPSSPLQTQPRVEVSPPPPVPPAAKGLGTPSPAAGDRRGQHVEGPVAWPPAHLKDELLPLDPSLEP